MKTLEEVKVDWAHCQKCALSNFDRKQVCFSDGPDDAKIMLVGEGPGRTENDTGIPFTGPAGQLMNRILALVGIRRQDVYWTNCVRCHPPSNRTPLNDELEACRPLLLTEIEIIRPRVILLAGLTPVRNLLKTRATMAEMAGKWATIKGIPAICMYHPAAVLHTEHRDPHTCQKYKNSIWKCVREVQQFLNCKKSIEPSIKVYEQDDLFK
jgi:DNA polymerase